MSEDGAPQPEASFLTIIYTMGTQAMIALGEIESPLTHQQSVDARQAQWQIDSLQVLQEKTEGNLTEEESTALKNVLAELKIKFVEKTA